jgi:pyruvate dehydrogenase E2 component (dihydrolipoamide acetyltransferase)
VPDGLAGAAGEVMATPAARRLARELGVDLAALGTGRRIREDDVRAFHAATAGPAPVAPAAAAIPYRGRRRTTAERMLRGQRTVAAVTLASEVAVGTADGPALTALVVRACALALREHPVLGGRLVEDRIELPETVDVGVAVEAPDGVVAPVLRGADALTLAETARAVRALAERAAAGRLASEDLEGATFTVVSLVDTVVDAFTPIVDPPQSAVLGVGRVREVPAFEGAAVVRRRVATLSLTFDHRVTDGAPAARFLGRVAELLGELG